MYSKRTITGEFAFYAFISKFIFPTNPGLSAPNFEQPGFMIGFKFYLNFLLNYSNRNKHTTFHSDISCYNIKACFNNNAAYNDISLDNTAR